MITSTATSANESYLHLAHGNGFSNSLFFAVVFCSVRFFLRRSEFTSGFFSITRISIFFYFLPNVLVRLKHSFTYVMAEMVFRFHSFITHSACVSLAHRSEFPSQRNGFIYFTPFVPHKMGQTTFVLVAVCERREDFWFVSVWHLECVNIMLSRKHPDWVEVFTNPSATFILWPCRKHQWFSDIILFSL